MPNPTSCLAEPAQARTLSGDRLLPDQATARGIRVGSWEVETPTGAMRARARPKDTLHPRVGVGEHGWWQDCEEPPPATTGSNMQNEAAAGVDAWLKDALKD